MYIGPQRKRQRLKSYDYSQNGFYFITICTKNRENYFGEINNGNMALNDYGEIVKNGILKTEELREGITIDEFIIMPNHLHLIVVIKTVVGCDCIAPIIQNGTTNNGMTNNGMTNNGMTNNGMMNNGMMNNGMMNNGITNNGTMQSFPTEGGFNVNGAIGLQGNHLSSIIHGLKSMITSEIKNKYNDLTFGWQKSFFDVIIKNEEQLNKTRQYIIDNPLKWEIDMNNKKNEKLVEELKKNKKGMKNS